MWANIRSIIDIAIVSFIIYRILVLLVDTRAIQLVKGLVILIVLSLLAGMLRFRLLSWFLGHTLWALSFAIPIVFHPELRKILEELGRNKFNFSTKNISSDEAEIRASHVINALSYLKAHKIGALLVFQQEDSLIDYTATAVQLNAGITQELIISIFWVGNPLHDGAVVLDKNKIVAGGCILPLADAPEISRWYGTRHRAGLGVTEKSDALVLIVSEERGEISVAAKGKLSKLKDFQVEKLVRHYFIGEAEEKHSRFQEFVKLFWVKPTPEAATRARGIVH
ncbi:MAG: diadenylate cyclase CdaA [Synergistaceae bacterium]|nr:diadenylate cyclase CdaA [Synergistaceae bacterium]